MGYSIKGVIGCFVFLLLVACEAPATPIPVGNPTEVLTTDTVTLATPTTIVSNIRIGVAENTVNYLDNLETLQSLAQVETFNDTTFAQSYDLAMSYGQVDGWEQAQSQDIILIINTNLAPLDRPEIAALVAQSIDLQLVLDTLQIAGAEALSSNVIASVQVRNTLANYGFPDGLQLSTVYDSMPALDALGESLSLHNIRLALSPLQSNLDDVLSQNLAHIILLRRPADSVSIENMIPLLRLPLSYRINPDVAIQFSTMGFPEPQS